MSGARLDRRHWLLAAGAGAAGLAAGAWSQTGKAPAPPAPGSAAAFPAPLATLDGHPLSAADVKGRAVVLNFWAPWCPPCVKEMPELDRFARSPAGKDVLVVGLAIDEKANVDKFLAAHPVGFPISVLGYAGLSRVRELGGSESALPFTAVFDRQGRLVRRKLGPTNGAELAGWLRKA